MGRLPGAMARQVADLLHAVGQLVLPRECAGCGHPDVALCARCRAELGAPVRCDHLTQQGGPSGSTPIPIWALAVYAASVRHAVLAWKSGGRPDLAAPLSGALAQAATELAVTAAIAPHDRLLVVPAPSGAARRRAGRFVVGELADAAGEAIAAATGAGVQVVDPLRRSRPRGHLLGAAARMRDRAGSTRSLCALPPGAACLLVDDVVTTGATLAASARALTRAGGLVVGALCLAVTAPPGSGLRSLR